MLLFPERGVGLFAFTNRTYGGPSGAVWQAAAALAKAGWLPRPAALHVSKPLAAAYATAGAIWRGGSVEPARPELAMNFLMDRSVANWARELARLKGEVGDCRTNAPITATGMLSGTFEWSCDRGRLSGQLLLAPTSPPTIQSLRLNPAH